MDVSINEAIGASCLLRSQPHVVILLDDDISHDDDASPSGLTVPAVAGPDLLRLRGGKGGFGSMLRAQGGKMASKKTTNFEACRDLSGRRMKTVNDAKKLAEFVEKEPERKKKLLEERKRKVEEGLKEPEVKKIRFDDTEYVEAHEKVLENVKDTVAKVMQKSMEKKDKGKGKVAEIVEEKKVKKMAWDEESDDDEEGEKSSEKSP
ncbi:hypothetical protein HK101_002681 [Irineochytrium annulatum]|nr:hypothetical protein HK101_002681 [Irineochytrium annulatum]